MKTTISKNKIIFLLTTILIIAQSCNVHIEKRRYRKGYYVEVSKKEKTHTVVDADLDPSVKTTINNPITLSIKNEIHIDSLKDIGSIEHKKKEKEEDPRKKSVPVFIKKKTGGDQCDIIHIKDGSTIEAIVTQISETEIRYKKCNYEEGPTYIISPSQVELIELKNGDVYKPTGTKTTTTNQPQTAVDGRMIVNMVLAGIGLLCLIIGVSFVLSYFGLISAIPLAISGLTSLIGIFLGLKYLKPGSHGLGKAAFWISLIVQILAIIFTALMFVF